jgi:hypothetical protein
MFTIKHEGENVLFLKNFSNTIKDGKFLLVIEEGGYI